MGRPIFLVEFSAKVWPTYLRSGAPDATGSWINGAHRVPVNAAKTYRITGKARRNAAADGLLYIGVALFDASHNNIAGDGTQWFYAASGVTANTSWTTYTATFGASTAKTFPGGAAYMVPLAILNYNSTAGYMECMELWIEDTAAAGVEISRDRYMRDKAAWVMFDGSAIAMRGTDVAGGNSLVQTRALRYSTSAYISAAGDTPASAPYEARVLNPGLVRSELPASMAGAISSNYGEIVLSNADGALSDWPYFGFDGQLVSVLYGQDDAARSTFTEVLRASIGQVTVDRKAARLRLRGTDSLLTRPVLFDIFVGDNALPDGVEGVADDLKGKPKPRLFGAVRGIAPPCVNTAKYVYQITTGVGAGSGDITEVRVRGLEVTRGTLRADLSTLMSTTPTAGTYDLALDSTSGLFMRLGTAPAGQVTCDAYSYSIGWGAGAAACAVWIAEIAGIDPINTYADTAGASVAPNYLGADSEWEQAGGPTAGVWINELTPSLELVEALCVSMGAWFGFTRWSGFLTGANEWGIEVFHPEPPALTDIIGLDCLYSINAVADPGPGRGTPAYRVTTQYRPRQTVISGDFDSSVSQADRAVLGAPWLSEQAEDQTILSKHPTARTVERKTVVDSAAVAASEAARLLELMRYPRQWFDISIALEAALALTDQPRLGGFVKLQWDTLQVMSRTGVTSDYGIFVVMALEVDLAKCQVRMTVREATETVA